MQHYCLRYMANIRCMDYGYDCDYMIEDSIEKVVVNYWEHMNNEHGIDYSKGRIAEIIKKKKSES